jgi:hypothetical protein
VSVLDAPVSMRRLQWLCVPVGLITAWYLWQVLRDGRDYRAVFHRPYIQWLPDLPVPVFTVVLIAGLVAALGMTVGLWRRVTSKVAFAVVAYHLLLSATNFHHNRAYLVIVLFVLAVSRLDLPEAPGWPLWLLRVECSVVYGASGLSKLVDPDWFSGTVTWLRVAHQESEVRASVLPEWMVDLVLDRDLHRLFAPGIVATELFIAVGVWAARTRPWALAVAVVFHILIELTSRVETFSYLAVAVILLIWLPAPDRLRGRVAQIVPNTSTQTWEGGCGERTDVRYSRGGVQQPVVDLERARADPLGP